MSELIDTTEMYLKTVYELEEDGVPPLRARIVERLDHSGPTVSQTVARMERDGLIRVADDFITIVMVSHDLIFASTRITGVAAVNRRLHQSGGRELTPHMLELIYGTHDASCPLDEYIRGVSSIFTGAGRNA